MSTLNKIQTFIIAATSKDGYIGKNAEHKSSDWTSKEDLRNFVRLTKRARALIVGSKTFETFSRNGDAPKPLPDRLNIIYSRSKRYEGENIMMTSDEPRVLLKKLEVVGFTEVAIAGGSEIYQMFLNTGLVDRIYLTVEPIEFGGGIPFYRGNLRDAFHLISWQTVNDTGTVFREYERLDSTGMGFE